MHVLHILCYEIDYRIKQMYPVRQSGLPHQAQLVVTVENICYCA